VRLYFDDFWQGMANPFMMKPNQKKSEHSEPRNV